MAAICELQTFGEVLLTKAAGPGVTFEITTEIALEIQWGICDGFDLAVESAPHPVESDCDFRSRIGMRIVQIESMRQSMPELRDSKYGRYRTRAMKSELEGHAAVGTFVR